MIKATVILTTTFSIFNSRTPTHEALTQERPRTSIDSRAVTSPDNRTIRLDVPTKSKFVG